MAPERLGRNGGALQGAPRPGVKHRLTSPVELIPHERGIDMKPTGHDHACRCDNCQQWNGRPIGEALAHGPSETAALALARCLMDSCRATGVPANVFARAVEIAHTVCQERPPVHGMERRPQSEPKLWIIV